MRIVLALAAAMALATVAASAQTGALERARPVAVPVLTVRDATVLQRTADQRWNALFAADRAFTQTVRDAIAAEIALRRSRGEDVAQLEGELNRLNADTQMSFNLQYLQLQSQMQHENRSYTAISSIMRTKHDTVRNSLSNVR
jgi:hypothetical protein